MQVNRLFKIVYLLLEKKTLTAGEMARVLEVSRRTVYRDVEALSMAGIPICMNRGKGGGISLMPGFVMDKALLSDRERDDILSSLQALRSMYPDSESSLEKVSMMLGESAADWIEIDFSSWYGGLYEKECFELLKESVLRQRTVMFRYASMKGEMTERTVEPLKICFKGHSWYLYGYCRTREGNRMFKINRMRELRTGGEAFQRKRPKSAFDDSPVASAQLERILLKIPGEMAYLVYDSFPRHKIQEDGSFIVEMMWPRHAALLEQVATFGTCCEVLEPPEARSRIERELAEMLSRYR